MGQLVGPDGRVVELVSRHRIGRDPWSDLVVSEPGVSGAHALVHWDGAGWSVRDLGSTNGTRVDGELVPVGLPVPLESGRCLTVGSHSWALADACAPRPLLVGPVRLLLDGPTAVPGSEAFLLPDGMGGWWVEEGERRQRLVDRQVLLIGGQRWTAHVDGVLHRTLEDRPDGPALRFRVSRDEEHVDLWICADGEPIGLAPRAHHYTLVTLARQRLADRSAGVPEADAGWLATPLLCRRLRLQRGAVYTHLYRARRQLVSAGFPSVADQLVEHRTEATQLRLGLARLEVADG